MARTSQHDYAEHHIRIQTLENDFAEVKAGLIGLSNKLDENISKISQMISARDKTPWGVISGMGSLILVIVGAFGSMALGPLRSDVDGLKTQIVPRLEIEKREKDASFYQEGVARWIGRIEQRQWEAAVETIRSLRGENDTLRRRLLTTKGPD